VVVVLDEFRTFGKANDQMMRLLFSVFRKLGFKLVLMGTNSSAANLVQMNKQNKDLEMFDFCHIFPRLPKFKLDALTLNLNSNQNWINDILYSSRPLFSLMAAEHIQDLIAGDIDAVFAKIADRAVSVKSIIQTCRESNPYGLHGQVCLFLNVVYREHSDDEKTAPHPQFSHFAHLEETKVIKLDGNLEIGGKEWKPIARFPTPSEDFLLTACLMGSKDFYPFKYQPYDRLLKLSFRKSADMFAIHADAPSLKFNDSNGFQKAGVGMFWEAVSASSLIVASRLNGVQGILLKDYIPAVFAQIQLSDELVDFTLGALENDSLGIFMNSFKVPFLSPPNRQWPGFVKDIPNSIFGNFSRTISEDKIELNSDFGLTGEAKNLNEIIGTVEMNEILNRIHDHRGLRTKASRVHFVFVKSLRKIESSKLCSDSFKNYCCAKLEVDPQAETLLHLRDIEGLSKLSEFDFKEDSTLVLFYEFDQRKSRKKRKKSMD
jgi:hypothetical protein